MRCHGDVSHARDHCAATRGIEETDFADDFVPRLHLNRLSMKVLRKLKGNVEKRGAGSGIIHRVDLLRLVGCLECL